MNCICMKFQKLLGNFHPKSTINFIDKEVSNTLKIFDDITLDENIWARNHKLSPRMRIGASALIVLLLLLPPLRME
jgi:hypothetical protein